MSQRRPFDLGAWLLVAMGLVLLVAGAATLVTSLVRGDWTAALVTTALLAVVVFGVGRGLGQLRRGRSTGPDPDPDDH